MKCRFRWWAAALLLAGASSPVVFQERSRESEPGWVTRQIQDLLSGPGRIVTIGRLSSSWSLDVAIRDIAIADDDGVWLNVDQAKLDWEPSALLRREFRISGLDLNRMALERLPAGQPESPPSNTHFSLPQLPDLPVGLTLQRLTVKRLDLGAPVIGGAAASLKIDASARLERGVAGIAANLKINRLDKPGSGKLVMDYSPQAEQFDLDMTVEEPEGGVIAHVGGFPGLPPVHLALRGSGPLAGWQGRLDGNADDIARVGADATIRGVQVTDGAQGYRLTISADAAFAHMLDQRTATLVGDSVTLQAEAAIDPNRRIVLAPLRMTLAAGFLELSGVYQFDPQALDFDYTMEADAGSSLRSLAPDVNWETIRLLGEVAGPVNAPTITADLAADKIDAIKTAVGRAALQLRAVPSGPLDQDGSTVAITLNGGLTNLTMASDPRVAQVASPEVKIAGNAVVTPGTGEIRVDNLRADTAVGAATATALVREWGKAVGAQVGFDVPDLAKLPDVPVSGAATVRTNLAMEGAGQTLRGTATADLTGLDSGDPALQRIIRDVAGNAVTFRLAANSDDAAQTVNVTELALNTLVGSLTGHATVREFGQDIAGNAVLDVPDLSRLAGVAGAPLEGAAKLNADLSGGNQATLVRADLSGDVTNLRTGTAPADALVGRKMNMFGLVTVGTDGSADLLNLKIDGQHVALTASGALKDNTLDAKWRASLPRLAVLAKPLQTPIAGSTVLDGTAYGPLDALEVRADLAGRDLLLSGRNVPRADLAVRATHLPGSPRGTLTAQAVVDKQPLDAKTAFALEGERLNLTDISLGAEQNRITGTIRVALDRMTASGKLGGDMRNLGVFSALAGQPLGGSGRLDVKLDDPKGQQAATATVRGQNISVTGPQGPVLAVRRLNLNADVKDALGAMRFDAKLDSSGIAAGGADLATLTASASGTPAMAQFQAQTKGKAGSPAQPARMALSGSFNQEGALQKLRLDKLDGTYGGRPFQLVNPATATIGPNRYEVRNLLLASRDGRIALDAGLVRNALEGTATVTRVPLSLASLAAPDLGVDGQLDGNATFAGTIADPRADLDLKVSDMSLEGGEAAGLTGIDINTTGRWRNGRLALDGNATTRKRGGIDMRLQAEVPLVLRQEPLTVDLPRNAPISAALRGNVELMTLNDLLATSGDQAQGRLDVNLTLGGSFGNPHLGGDAGIANGRYENQAAGMVISEITMQVRGDGKRLTIDRFDGLTPDGGAVKASGSVNVDPADAQAFNLRVGASSAQLVQIDLVTAKIDTLLNLTGPLANPLLQGLVTIERADIRIPEQMPPSVVEIQVKEINRPGGDPAPAKRTAAGTSPFQLRLDLAVKARNQIFVRGRGLTVEMSSDVTVGGTTAKPNLGGGLKLVNGSLELLTIWFEFTQANVDFADDGGADPMLDVSAQARAADIMARVGLTGRASAPRITLTSTPELPEDEILARVLFNKPLSNLNAVEAVLIAQSISRLTGIGGIGGTPGIFGKMRRSLSLDRLRLVGSNQGDGVSGTAVAAGRYITRDVYVGAEQRVGEAGSRAVVEINLTRNVRIRTDVGTNSGGNISVLYEWEY
jgi:translocation and assembly module TamB